MERREDMHTNAHPENQRFGPGDGERAVSHGIGPFVHRFETENGKFVYDAGTMRIARVDEVAWEIIPDVGELTREEIVTKYADRFAVDQIAVAHDDIVAQQQEGFFLSKRPKVEFTWSEEQIRHKLQNERQILTLNVTERCNFRCKYCTYDGHHTNQPGHSAAQMDWLTAKQALDEFVPHSVDSDVVAVTFYGGEPLLHIELIKECVSYVRRTAGGRKTSFGLTINGSLLTGKTAEFLAAEDFNVSVSLDGPRELHDRYRRTVDDRPTWDDVTQNVREFVEKYPQYKSRMQFIVTLAPPSECRGCRSILQYERLVPSGGESSGVGC